MKIQFRDAKAGDVPTRGLGGKESAWRPLVAELRVRDAMVWIEVDVPDGKNSASLAKSIRGCAWENGIRISVRLTETKIYVCKTSVRGL